MIWMLRPKTTYGCSVFQKVFWPSLELHFRDTCGLHTFLGICSMRIKIKSAESLSNRVRQMICLSLYVQRFNTFIFEVRYSDRLFETIVGTFSRMAAINRSAFGSICAQLGVCFLGLFVPATRILQAVNYRELRRYSPSAWDMQDSVHFVQGSRRESYLPAPE